MPDRTQPQEPTDADPIQRLARERGAREMRVLPGRNSVPAIREEVDAVAFAPLDPPERRDRGRIPTRQRRQFLRDVEDPHVGMDGSDSDKARDTVPAGADIEADFVGRRHAFVATATLRGRAEGLVSFRGPRPSGGRA